MEEAHERFVRLLHEHDEVGENKEFSLDNRKAKLYINETDDAGKLELSHGRLEIGVWSFNFKEGWPEDGNPKFVNTIMDTAEYIIKGEWPDQPKREPGEFKIGDIIRYKASSAFSDECPDGYSYTKIIRVEKDRLYGYWSNHRDLHDSDGSEGFMDPDDVELVEAADE